jgi:hypothetical protein
MFLNTSRIPEFLCVLQYDRFLVPAPDRTIIYYGNVSTSNPESTDIEIELLNKFAKYGINAENFTLVNDKELFDRCDFNLTEFGGWIYQQLIKLLAVDACTDSQILIQDGDSFAIKPYVYFDNNQPVYSVRLNTTDFEDYAKYVEQIINLPRLTTSSFVTEFMPIEKRTWNLLKEKIVEIHKCNWLSALAKVFRLHNTNTVGTFSEYELLGTWALHLNPNLKMQPQDRWYREMPIHRLEKANFVNTHRNSSYDEMELLRNRINPYIKNHEPSTI